MSASLKKSVMLSLSLLVFSVLLLAFSWYQFTQMSQRHNEAKTQKQDAQMRYFRASSDAQLFDEYKERFNVLQQKNIIGQENRLSWAETLHDLELKYGINRLDTNISPKQPYVHADSPPSLRWYASQQNVRMGLLHEGDFIALMTKWSQQASGLMNVSSCKLTRAEEITMSAQANNVLVDCQLKWLSLELEQREVVQ